MVCIKCGKQFKGEGVACSKCVKEHLSKQAVASVIEGVTKQDLVTLKQHVKKRLMVLDLLIKGNAVKDVAEVTGFSETDIVSFVSKGADIIHNDGWTGELQELLDKFNISKKSWEKLVQEAVEYGKRYAKQCKEQAGCGAKGSRQQLISSDIFYDGEIGIEVLDLSSRSFNALKRVNIDTVEDLLRTVDTAKLRRIKNFGKKCFAEVLYAMRVRGMDGWSCAVLADVGADSELRKEFLLKLSEFSQSK